MAALIRQKLHKIKKVPADSGARAELKGIRDMRTLVTQLLAHEQDHSLLTDFIVQKLSERTTKKAIKLRYENPGLSTLVVLQKMEDLCMKDSTIEKLTSEATKSQKKENIRYAIELADSDGESDEEAGAVEPQLTALSPTSHSQSIPFVKISPMKEQCSLCGKHSSGQEDRCRSFPNPEERAARARQLRLCFRCLVGGSNHNFRQCQALRSHCSGKHHKALCKRMTFKREHKAGEAVRVHTEDQEGVEDDDYEDYCDEMIKDLEMDRTRDRIYQVLVTHDIMKLERIPSSKLMTFQGYLVHPTTGVEHSVNIMLDPGASVSLVSERAACILGLRAIGEAETAFSGVGGRTSEFRPHKIFIFKVKSSVKDSTSLQILAYEHADPLTGPERVFEFSSRDRHFIQKNRLDSALLMDSDRPPDVLVGLDESLECLSTGQKPVILPSGMKLLPSSLGYIRAGAIKGKIKDTVQCLLPEMIRMMHETERWDPSQVVSKRRRLPSGTMNCDLVNQVTRAEEARTKLIMENLARFLSADLSHCELERDLTDEEVRSHFKNTLTFEEGKGYTVRWARKPGIENLPSNLHIAFQRLLRHRSLCNQSVRTAIQDAVNDLLNREFIEIIQPHEIDREQVSTLLIQFRARPTVVCADVEKAFHTVKLDKRDRDLCRFLWFKEGEVITADNPYDDSIMHYRFVVVPFGVVQSPFLLNAVIAYHMEKKVEELTKQNRHEDGSLDQETTRVIQLCRDILQNLYVDNVAFGSPDSRNLEKDMRTAKALFKEMGISDNYELLTPTPTEASLWPIVQEEKKGSSRFSEFRGIPTRTHSN
ncbi:hypothetical protein PENTCL1PPCAC_19766 [Pristionchus entomophagus]|uniref:Reverse transcriptase domain-containing protein n=1 Tax=Pristionchus entomophagus TaxID=358040 RepID=A0AAV5TT70_9BILA|nr:hypothetical protein PENTCL1PPCAC_19766 [Pristionchus entomophagus]